MSTPLTDAINALTQYSNSVTGQSDQNLSDAVYTLAQGFGSGGGEEVWELIRDYTPSEDVNKITIATDEDGASFSLKKAIIICQYQASNTTTNNNEVVFDMRGGFAQFAGVTNCNSTNAYGDCIIDVDCSTGIEIARISYGSTAFVTTGFGSGVATIKQIINTSVSTMESFMMRLGNSTYTFNSSTTRIRIYGVRA